MKRILLFTVSMLCLLVAKAGVITHSETFNTSGWTFHDETVDATTYTSITCDGIDLLSEPGKPQLPVKYVRLVVPYNATNISVTATCVTASTETLTNKVLPAEEPQIADETASETPIIHEDSTVYNVNALFPAAHAEIVSDGYFMGENHVITVALYPMQYNPMSGQVLSYSSLTASVSYSLGTAPANLLHRSNVNGQNEDLALLADMVQNASQIHAFKAPARPTPIQGSSFSEPLVESYDYTIITTRELEPAFERLISLKKQKGYTAGTVCVEDIMQNPNVNGGDSIFDTNNILVSVIPDSAGVIRQYLKKAFVNGTKYVLIGGKSVPYRYGYRNASESGDIAIEHTVPTDWYYCELNANWNQNNNLFWGEQKLFKQKFDKYPELFVGRILADNQEDITNYFDKLRIYELNPGNGDYSYLSKAIIVQGAKGFDSEHSVAEALKSIGMDTTMVNQFDTIFPTGKYVIDKLKNYGYISVHGHGNPHATTVNYVDAPNYRICPLDYYDNTRLHPESGNGLDQINNKYHPSVFYSWSCKTTPFDIFSIRGKTYNGWNMGQSYTLGKDYGGVAYFGNTRDGYESFHEVECSFINQIETYHHAGQAEAMSKTTCYYDSIYYNMVHNLIGEPEFSIRTDIPRKFNHVSTRIQNRNLIIDGLNGDEVSIGVCSNDNQNLYITNNQVDTIPLSKLNCSAMIYGHNRIPLFTPLYLQNCDISKSQYVITPYAVIGNKINADFVSGDVILHNGVKYELETNNGITIQNGFTVEKGAEFKVLITK